MKEITLLFVAVLVMFQSYGQKEERDANYHFKQGNYAVALRIYSELVEKDSNNLEYVHRLGLCYLNCNNSPDKALSFFERANTIAGKEYVSCYDMGYAKMYTQEFDDAIAYFERCKLIAVKDDALIRDFDTWISMCKNAKKYYANPLDLSFVNMGKYINSAMDEYTPIISPDGKFLIYTSNQKYDSKFLYYYNNVYMVESSNGVFKKGKSVSAVNSMEDEFVAGYAMSGERLYVQLQGYEGYEDIFYTKQRGRSFQSKNKLDENINSKSSEYAATETINGDTLFFSSNRDGGMGGMDIYYSLKLPTGTWSVARNLGSEINTPYDEDFPMLSPDGSHFYFCSNRPESMGGFDVFESKILGDKSYSTPKNLGYPLNDVFDNKTIAFSPNQRYAYVSAIRPDGFGFSDLYQVIFNQEDPSVKIFLLQFKTGNKDAAVDLAKQDTTMKIVVYQKGKVVFGEYAYDSENSEAAIALPPGSYSIEFSGAFIKPYHIKLEVPDVPTDKKIEKKNVFVELK